MKLSQTQMAEDLGISTSYLNLIERDQRPVSARVLLKLAETYNLDLRILNADGPRALTAALKRVAADPLLAPSALDTADVQDLAERQPRAADALVRLYEAYQDTVHRDTMTPAGSSAGAAARNPFITAREACERLAPYLPELESAAVRVFRRDKEGLSVSAALAQRLQARHGLGVQVLPAELMETMLHRLDRHGRRVQLSDALPEADRAFALAYHLALIDGADALQDLVDQLDLSHSRARELAQTAGAKYMAAAMLAPYDRAFPLAQSVRFDVDAFAQRFGLSVTQAARRLSALRRRGREGPAFIVMRVDGAGRVLSRSGAVDTGDAAVWAGPCARWLAFDPANRPGEDRAQLIQIPSGARWAVTARLTARPGVPPSTPGAWVTLVMACPQQHAHRWRGADSLDVSDAAPAVAIGPGCLRCDVQGCLVRAEPPLRWGVEVDASRGGVSPFVSS